MTREEIHKAVLDALAGVAPELDASALDPKADLRDALDLDSIDHLNFVVALHKATGIDVPQNDYRRMATLDGCVDYLFGRTKAA